MERDDDDPDPPADRHPTFHFDGAPAPASLVTTVVSIPFGEGRIAVRVHARGDGLETNAQLVAELKVRDA